LGGIGDARDQGTFKPEDRADWRRWLEENHDRSSGVWMIIFKKGARQGNLTLDDAVEEALSFGWINSMLRPVDDSRAGTDDLGSMAKVEETKRPETRSRRIDALVGADQRVERGVVLSPSRPTRRAI